jgi:hypothetical protein
MAAAIADLELGSEELRCGLKIIDNQACQLVDGKWSAYNNAIQDLFYVMPILADMVHSLINV